MKDLRRDEARERAELLEVASYDVALDVTGGSTHFGSVSVVAFSCREPGASSFVELDGELLTAELNGRSLGPLTGNRLVLPDLQADNLLLVSARFAYSNTGEGLHRFVDPADGRTYLWGMSFLDDAQRMFACFDQPDLKASIRLTVDAPPGTSVVANARGERSGERWVFRATERMSTYAFTVAIGPWHGVHREHDGIALGLHCRQSLAPYLDADADELFEITGQCFDLQQQLYGRRYPFGDTYDQLFVPDFNHGAMENPGAVTFTEDFVFRSRVTDDARRKRAMVVAHEMAHMWFGNLVTMRWWDDLWLNESFAELMGFLTTDRATRFEGTWEEFSASRKAWGYRADQLPSTHPVQGDVPDNRSALLNFDGISYAKGASVLRQLMATVGEAPFFAGVRAYLDRHAFGNASFADLLAELEAASGRDLQEWSRVWLQTSGLSTLRPVVVDGRVEVLQESAVLRPHRIGAGLYDRTQEGLVLRTRLDLAVQAARSALGLEAADLPDLLLLNDGDLSFAKVRFDERSLSTALSSVGELRDPLARALVWASLWDACRDGELPASSLVQAVLGGVDSEADPAVVQTLLGQARTAALLYAVDGEPLVDALAHASLVAALQTAPPGSDLQLTRVRALARVTRDPAPLEALLTGTAPEGLVVDTELRWTLLEALAALGGASDAAVDEELARDDTAAGRLHALTCRAAMPTAAAKERAWAQAMDPASSNLEVRAVTGGLWQHRQEEVLAPYVDRYVAELPQVWPQRTPSVAGTLAQALFPTTLLRQDVLDRTAVLLAPAQPAGLRRFVAEQRDDLARALHARSTG